MPNVHSVSNITNILSTIIKTEDTLQGIWVYGKVLPLSSDFEISRGGFLLKDANSNEEIECVIFEENAHLFADLLVGDNVLVKGRISLHRSDKSEYRFVIKDKQPLGTVPTPASVSGLIETLRNTVREHSAKVQGKISNSPAIADSGFLQLYLKNANNAEMIVCVLPPSISRNPSFLLQRDTEVSIQGKFDIFTPMSQYQIKITNPNDIQSVSPAPDEEGQTVVDVVHTYLDALETDGLLTKREHEIQFGSRNGFADVVLIDQNGSFAAIVECKQAGYVGHGVEQLKSYLCATDTRFGIFANRTDPEQWEFYENRRRNRFDPIDRSEFETGVVKGIVTRERLRDEIANLNGEIAGLENQRSELDTTVNQITQTKCHLTEHDSKLAQEIGTLENYKSELHEEIHQGLDDLLEEKMQRLERPLSDMKIELQKRGIVNWFKNLFSKENE